MRISHVSNLDSPTKYAPGDLVRLDGVIYQVAAASHAHLQLEGLTKAVPVWLVKGVRGKKKDVISKNT